MKEIPFSLPVSGVIRINSNVIEVIVNRAETKVELEGELGPTGRISLKPGTTLSDVALEIAKKLVRRKGVNRFSGAELYHQALEDYPQLKRNSFMSRVIASTPDHPSYRHYASNRDFFSHIGTGLYRLNDRYVADKPSVGEQTLLNH